MSGKEVYVIGGGPGGYVAAIRAAQLGARVTLVERDKLGGTCLNIGCIPTKCMLHSAELIRELRERGAVIGVEAENVRVNFPRVIAYQKEVSARLAGGVAGLLKTNRVTVVSGEAAFAAEKTLRIAKPDGASETVHPENIILATGSRNVTPPIPGVKDNPDCIDSTGALALGKLPASMAVIGGGVVGMEIACAYAAFGTKVTIIEIMPEVLPMMDGELTKIAIEHMRKTGVRIELETAVQSVAKGNAGTVVRCKNKLGEAMEVEAEKVLIAVGRRANTESLRLSAGGVENDCGRVLVNDRMETSIPGVYAVGDCVFGKAQLAHAASAMGEIAAENSMGGSALFDPSTSPSCVYGAPEFAGVGLTEEQAKAKGIDYVVGKFQMAANGKALILNGGVGMVKIIAGKEFGEILGMHILGPRASDLIAEGALAIRLEATLDEIIDTIHAHPTVAEAIREAALHAKKRAIHRGNR